MFASVKNRIAAAINLVRGIQYIELMQDNTNLIDRETELARG